MSNEHQPGPALCPTAGELEAFRRGRLSEADLRTIAAHLETCRLCTTVLDGLEPSDPDAVAVAAGVSQWKVVCADPVFQKLQAFSRTLPVPGEGLARRPEPVHGAADPGTPSLAAPATETSRRSEADQPPGVAPEPEKTLPEKVGDYFVLRKLGEGGFGIVYLAKDPRQDMTVAVKVPKAGPRVTEKRIQAFLREARTVAELNHPRIVPVRDFQRLPDYGCCVVMPYLEGGSLARFLQRERVDYVRAAEWIADLAEPVYELHRRKLYHRDIKPANVLLDAQGRPHLTDFGLALLDDDRWLHRDELAGTRAYMSPEQVQGRTQFMDSRTDIWSLGVILYELLTRERPFRGRTAEEITEEILHKHPNPRLVNVAIPVELERICIRCLKKEPDERYTNALDLATDLRAWIATQPATAGSLAGRNRGTAVAGATRLRRRTVFTAVSLIAVIALAAVAITYWPKGPAGPAGPGESGESGVSGGAEHASVAPGPVFVPGPKSWIPLLEREPAIFWWQLGEGREAPRFDSREQRFTVRSNGCRWIARGVELDLQPLQFRASVSVDTWVGAGGLVWGLREDPDAFPEKRYRAFAVEYMRSAAVHPARLMAIEMFLTEHGFNDIRLTRTNTLAMQTVEPPPGSQALLEVAVEAHRLRIRFNRQEEWVVTDQYEPVDWLPDGRTAVGLMGQGRETAIRGFAFRSLPAAEESSP